MLPIPGVSNELNELVIAIRNGDLNRASNLIGNNPLPEGGYFLLCTAIGYKQREIAKLLMSKAANVNDYFQHYNHMNTPLHFAVMNRDIEIVRMLLNHRANVDTEGVDGKTVLHLAVEQEDSLMVQEILSHHPDIDNDSNKNSLKVAVDRCQKSSNDIVESLVRYGFTIHPQDAHYSKLWRAVIGKMCPKTIENLLTFHCRLYRWARTFSVNLGIVRKRLKEIIEILWDRDYAVTEIYECKRKRSVREVAFANQEPLPTDDVNVIFRILRLIKTLFESGSVVSAKTEAGLMLRLAVQNEVKDILQIVAEYCPDVNMKIESGMTLLHFLVKAEAVYDCELLIERGADVNAKDKSGFTALHLAVHSRQPYTTELLLKHGADVNLTNESGFSALHLAAVCQGTEFARILLVHHTDVNLKAGNDVTALHLSAMAGTRDVCICLVQCGADIMARTTYGLTALHTAVLCCRPNIVQFLLIAGAEIDSRDEIGYTALPFEFLKRQIYTTLYRINDGSDINFVNVHSQTAFNESGFTALHLAIRCEHEDIVEMLLQCGANVNLKSRSGVTALHLAVVAGLTRVFRSLVERGAYVNAETEHGITALHVAALFNRSCMMRILLDSVADIDAVDEKGNTALHFAVLAEKKLAFLILIINGCDLNIANKYYETAFDLIPTDMTVTHSRLLSSFESTYCLSPIHEREQREQQRRLLACTMSHRRGVSYNPCVGGCCPTVDENVSPSDFMIEYRDKLVIPNLYLPRLYLGNPNANTESPIAEQCREEITKLKITRIGNTNVTFYDVLTKPVDQVAEYASNESIVVQVLELNNYQREFPVYADLIKICFERGMNRKELLGESHKCLRRFSSVVLPHDSIRKILSYLSKSDLITLKKIHDNL